LIDAASAAQPPSTVQSSAQQAAGTVGAPAPASLEDEPGAVYAQEFGVLVQ